MTPHTPDLLRLQDALDGRLSEFDRAAVAHHLAACEACRRQSAALRWTKLRLAGASGMAVPASLADEVTAALTRPVAPADPAPADPPPADTAPPTSGWRRWRTRVFGR